MDWLTDRLTEKIQGQLMPCAVGGCLANYISMSVWRYHAHELQSLGHILNNLISAYTFTSHILKLHISAFLKYLHTRSIPGFFGWYKDLGPTSSGTRWQTTLRTCATGGALTARAPPYPHIHSQILLSKQSVKLKAYFQHMTNYRN